MCQHRLIRMYIYCVQFFYIIFVFFLHDFIENSTPIEKQWTTLFLYYMERSVVASGAHIPHFCILVLLWQLLIYLATL